MPATRLVRRRHRPLPFRGGTRSRRTSSEQRFDGLYDSLAHFGFDLGHENLRLAPLQTGRTSDSGDRPVMSVIDEEAFRPGSLDPVRILGDAASKRPAFEVGVESQYRLSHTLSSARGRCRRP